VKIVHGWCSRRHVVSALGLRYRLRRPPAHPHRGPLRAHLPVGMWPWIFIFFQGRGVGVLLISTLISPRVPGMTCQVHRTHALHWAQVAQAAAGRRVGVGSACSCNAPARGCACPILATRGRPRTQYYLLLPVWIDLKGSRLQMHVRFLFLESRPLTLGGLAFLSPLPQGSLCKTWSAGHIEEDGRLEAAPQPIVDYHCGYCSASSAGASVMLVRQVVEVANVEEFQGEGGGLRLVRRKAGGRTRQLSV
jgi:hypothetical protein